jgi:hypothetical protein
MIMLLKIRMLIIKIVMFIKTKIITLIWITTIYIYRKGIIVHQESCWRSNVVEYHPQRLVALEFATLHQIENDSSEGEKSTYLQKMLQNLKTDNYSTVDTAVTSHYYIPPITSLTSKTSITYIYIYSIYTHIYIYTYIHIYIYT